MLPLPSAPSHRRMALYCQVGHSYGGVVITEAGNDPKVVGLVYVAALAPSEGESVASVTKPFPQAPLGSEVRKDVEGFLTVTPKGIAEDFAQDLPNKEKQLLTATQGPTAAVFLGPQSRPPRGGPSHLGA